MKLDLDRVSVRYGARTVVEEASAAFEPGRIAAILGPNGAGKTTLLKTMNGILAPHRGAVLVGERPLREIGSREAARLLGYVPQRAEAGRMTVFDAVLLGRTPHMGLRVRPTDLEACKVAIDRLGLSPMALRMVDELSGGELQKVLIARALAQEPGVLLLDEPTSSLDMKNALDIMHTVEAVVRGQGLCAVMTLHDLNAALRFADVLVFVKAGRIRAVLPRDGVDEAIVEETYGVKATRHRHGGVAYFVVEPRAGLSQGERDNAA